MYGKRKQMSRKCENERNRTKLGGKKVEGLSAQGLLLSFLLNKGERKYRL